MRLATWLTGILAIVLLGAGVAGGVLFDRDRHRWSAEIADQAAQIDELNVHTVQQSNDLGDLKRQREDVDQQVTAGPLAIAQQCSKAVKDFVDTLNTEAALAVQARALAVMLDACSAGGVTDPNVFHV
jgi:hypothetical protein